MSHPDPFHRLTLCDEALLLHCERVLYWPVRRTLILADLHLGKEHSFGRAGIAIPAGNSEADLARLMRLIRAFGATRVLILGDLIHAPPQPTEPWLQALSGHLDALPEVQFQVVAGNHDRPAGQARIDPRVRWTEHVLQEGPFVFTHDPQPPPTGAVGYRIGGHLHPVYRLGIGRQGGVRAPVFWVQKCCTVLPAFGGFTGGHPVQPAPGDRLLMAGPDRVVLLPPHTSRRTGRRPRAGR